jgi:hypothetical protein
MLEVVKANNNLTESEIENTRNVLVSFGMGLISHLVDSDVLVLPNDTEELSMAPETAATFITLMTVIAEEDDLDE